MNAPRSVTGTRSEPRRIDSAYPLVEFSAPVDPRYVRVVRLAAGDMAERAGFSVDEIEDVRLAVDELCAILIAASGEEIHLRMQSRDGVLIIDGRTPRAQTLALPSSISEALLQALVDSCRFSTQHNEMSFEMTKQARDIA